MVVEAQSSPSVGVDESHESSSLGVGDCVEGALSQSTASTSPNSVGMQHKFSTTWKNAYNTEYPAMADDGLDNSATSITNGVHGTTNSIVNGILRKTSSFGDTMGIGTGGGGGGSGLEQKIQELRAEKEAGELKKCPSSIHNDQDSPLDFSVKRRSSFSGSLTDDSQASSSSPGHITDYNAVSPPASDLGHAGAHGDSIRRSSPSPDRLEDQQSGGPAFPGGPAVSTMPPLLNGMSMFPGLPSNILGNGSAMNAFSQMAAAAAFMDPRSKKNNRPFKAYPKEALQMPLGFFGIPGLTSQMLQQCMDSGMLAGMNNEDIVNLYKQQLQLFREKPQSPGQSGNTSPLSQVSTSNGNHSQHHHHQQHQPQQPQQHHQLQQHHNHQLPSPPPIPQQFTAKSMSPPHTPPDHLKASVTPSPSFPTHATPASLNATLVSSTSSFTHSNSRKRPRSLPDDQKDAAYWERRRKNNDAAKRSRDARRAKEDEIAIRAALLEQENLKLRVEVAALKTETARLRCLLYNS